MQALTELGAASEGLTVAAGELQALLALLVELDPSSGIYKYLDRPAGASARQIADAARQPPLRRSAQTEKRTGRPLK